MATEGFSFRFANLAWLALGLALACSSTVRAAAPPAAVGDLVLELHNSRDTIPHRLCVGTLIAPDVVVTSASCFDAMRRSDGTLARNDFDASFALPGAAAPIGTLEVSIHPSYQPILCFEMTLDARFRASHKPR